MSVFHTCVRLSDMSLSATAPAGPSDVAEHHFVPDLGSLPTGVPAQHAAGRTSAHIVAPSPRVADYTFSAGHSQVMIPRPVHARYAHISGRSDCSSSKMLRALHSSSRTPQASPATSRTAPPGVVPPMSTFAGLPNHSALPVAAQRVSRARYSLPQHTQTIYNSSAPGPGPIRHRSAGTSRRSFPMGSTRFQLPAVSLADPLPAVGKFNVVFVPFMVCTVR